MTVPIPFESLPPVAISELLGTWHIVETNFGMWVSGKRTKPSLNYVSTGSDSRVEDIVRYTERGRAKEIRGFDAVDPKNSAHLTWRGRGLLSLLKSEWYVVHLDPVAGVVAIYFEPTLFTAAGVDIAAREPEPDRATIDAARAAVNALPGLAPHVPRLVRLATLEK